MFLKLAAVFPGSIESPVVDLAVLLEIVASDFAVDAVFDLLVAADLAQVVEFSAKWD